jgi:hypothetical protein
MLADGPLQRIGLRFNHKRRIRSFRNILDEMRDWNANRVVAHGFVLEPIDALSYGAE